MLTQAAARDRDRLKWRHLTAFGVGPHTCMLSAGCQPGKSAQPHNMFGAHATPPQVPQQAHAQRKQHTTLDKVAAGKTQRHLRAHDMPSTSNPETTNSTPAGQNTLLGCCQGAQSPHACVSPQSMQVACMRAPCPSCGSVLIGDHKQHAWVHQETTRHE